MRQLDTQESDAERENYLLSRKREIPKETTEKGIKKKRLTDTQAEGESSEETQREPDKSTSQENGDTTPGKRISRIPRRFASDMWVCAITRRKGESKESEKGKNPGEFVGTNGPHTLINSSSHGPVIKEQSEEQDMVTDPTVM
jgi:hypothetical protein